ncbi:MAG TPA: TolC family protein [Gemmatimonadaceae bacterium]|nr:TolC family protein [Gemmatimonadaceae bacterium]
MSLNSRGRASPAASRRRRPGAVLAATVTTVATTLAAALLVPVATAGAQVAPAGGAATADSVVVLTSPGAAARIAAERSAGVEAARLRAAQAEARIGQERADLLPSASLELSDGQRTFNTASFGIDFPTEPGQPPLFDPNGQIEGPVRTVDVRGRVAAPLLDLPALARVRTARTEAEAAGAVVERSAESAALAGAQSFIRAVRAAALVRAREADSALAADLLGIARDQLEAGVGVGLDVTRAEAQVASAHAQLIAARADRDRTQLELRRALGLPLDTPLVIPDTLAPTTAAAAIAGTPGVAPIVEQAMQQRADVRAAELQLEAARRDVAAIRAERLPTIGVFIDDGGTGLDYSHLLNTYTYGVQLSVPLFEGFRRESRVEEQQAVARELDVRRRDLRQQVALEVRSAALDLAAAGEQVEAARERLRLAQQEVAQARERFAAGVSGNADIVSASLALNTARTQLVDALAAQHSARVTLAAAGGTVTELP